MACVAASVSRTLVWEALVPSRMSNRDRIQRMAAEAEAKRQEKQKNDEVKKKAKKTSAKKTSAKKPATRKKGASKGRVKIVWAVSVPAGNALKIFPYREKAQAEAEAARLTLKKGTLHVVRSERQAMTDDE